MNAARTASGTVTLQQGAWEQQPLPASDEQQAHAATLRRLDLASSQRLVVGESNAAARTTQTSARRRHASVTVAWSAVRRLMSLVSEEWLRRSSSGTRGQWQDLGHSSQACCAPGNDGARTLEMD